MKPRVSICVPNLNTRPFLPERFRTILAQSLKDWELLVYDSYSTDGAWEYIQELAASEPRARAWQGPREGTPGSWTPCVREARGEYVYIATSDDTMPPDCLEALAAALDAHPDCDIAHCPLRPIDEHGRELPGLVEWWRHAAFVQSNGTLASRMHVRRAPFDGLLHLLGGSVYVSITQLLIRRSLFDRIGWFQSTWGSVGDFNWDMRAGLAANTVHVPTTWGGWRVHSSQATGGVRIGSPEHASTVDAMIEDAVEQCRPYLSPGIQQRLTSNWLSQAAALRAFNLERARNSDKSMVGRAGGLAWHVCAGSWAAREYLSGRILRRPPVDWVRRLMEAAGEGPMLVPVDRDVHVAPSRRESPGLSQPQSIDKP